MTRGQNIFWVSEQNSPFVDVGMIDSSVERFLTSDVVNSERFFGVSNEGDKLPFVLF